MKQGERIRVCIAVSHSLLREGLVSVINREVEMEVVGQIEKASEVMEAMTRTIPNVLLIDLRLDGANSLEVVRNVREKFPSTAILAISDSEGSEDVYRAIRTGARGYLLHDVSGAELVQAIRTVSMGRRHIPPEIATRLAERMDRSTLSPRELEVLLLIIKGKSNKQIADVLDIVEGTVKFHVNGILQKLGVSDRTGAATAALLRGIVHPDDLG